MKITTTVKTSMITLALGVAFMLPATARAQSDVSPGRIRVFRTANHRCAARAVCCQANCQGRFSGQSFAAFQREVWHQVFEGRTVFALGEV